MGGREFAGSFIGRGQGCPFPPGNLGKIPEKNQGIGKDLNIFLARYSFRVCWQVLNPCCRTSWCSLSGSLQIYTHSQPQSPSQGKVTQGFKHISSDQPWQQEPGLCSSVSWPVTL